MPHREIKLMRITLAIPSAHSINLGSRRSINQPSLLKSYQFLNKNLYAQRTNLNKIFMSIISLSIPKSLLEKVDNYIKEQGFANRSEVIRQALRAYVSEGKRLDELKGKVTATITVIYQKGARTGQTTDAQHSSRQRSFNVSAHPHRGRLLHRNHRRQRRSRNHESLHNSHESKQANFRG